MLSLDCKIHAKLLLHQSWGLGEDQMALRRILGMQMEQFHILAIGAHPHQFHILAIVEHLAISVSFLIRTSGKDSHSQAGSTKHIHISSRSLQLEQFYIRSVPHPCNWSSSTEFISTFSTNARLTWVQVRRQCTFRNFCKLAESGYHIFFIIWSKSLA